MTTRNENLPTGVWTKISLARVSNIGNQVEFWAGTVAPTADSQGHPLFAAKGFSAEEFESGDEFWFKPSYGTGILTVTE